MRGLRCKLFLVPLRHTWNSKNIIKILLKILALSYCPGIENSRSFNHYILLLLLNFSCWILKYVYILQIFIGLWVDFVCYLWIYLYLTMCSFVSVRAARLWNKYGVLCQISKVWLFLLCQLPVIFGGLWKSYLWKKKNEVTMSNEMVTKLFQRGNKCWQLAIPGSEQVLSWSWYPTWIEYRYCKC